MKSTGIGGRALAFAAGRAFVIAAVTVAIGNVTGIRAADVSLPGTDRTSARQRKRGQVVHFWRLTGQAGQFTRTWQRHSHRDPLICGSSCVRDLLAGHQVITTATVPESNDGARIWWVVHLLKHNAQSTKRPTQQNTDTRMALQRSLLAWSIHLSGENVPLPVSLPRLAARNSGKQPKRWRGKSTNDRRRSDARPPLTPGPPCNALQRHE